MKSFWFAPRNKTSCADYGTACHLDIVIYIWVRFVKILIKIRILAASNMADTVDGTNPAVEEGTPFPGADGDAANDGGGQPRIKRRTSLQAVKEAIKQQPLPNTKLVKYLFSSFLPFSFNEARDKWSIPPSTNAACVYRVHAWMGSMRALVDACRVQIHQTKL